MTSGPAHYRFAAPDGPGSLQSFHGQAGRRRVEFDEVDDAWTQTGIVRGWTADLAPHQDFKNTKLLISVPAQGWFYDYIDVPAGYTNLFVYALDLQPNPPNFLVLGVKLGSEPSLADTNGLVALTVPVTNSVFGGSALSNSVSIGPPLSPGRYYVGVYNPDTTAHYVLLGIRFGLLAIGHRDGGLRERAGAAAG